MIKCEYCTASNPDGLDRCAACGAPLVRPKPIAYSVTQVTSVTSPPPVLDSTPMTQQVKEGLTAAGAGLGVLGISGFLFRTGAQAVAIAFSAFLVGMTSGALHVAWAGALGGFIIGLAVGLVSKRAFLTLISAPFGALLGVALAILLRVNTPGQPWMPLLAALGGGVLAVLGGYRNTTGLMKWYERFRPLLGIAGGLLFALLGYLAGNLIY